MVFTHQQRQAKAREIVAGTIYGPDAVGLVYEWLETTGDNLDVVKAALDVARSGGSGNAVIRLWLDREYEQRSGYVRPPYMQKPRRQQEVVVEKPAERNQAAEILACIRERGPIAAEDIARKTGWNRHWVDVAGPMMIEAGLIEIVSKSEWGEPTYRALDRATYRP